jgi:alkylation response protein AidB-like acyl-CoA dehydrogenase
MTNSIAAEEVVVPFPRDDVLTRSQIEVRTETLAQALARTAVTRDRLGGHAAFEREAIRDSGLLALSIPRAFGGIGADWATVYRSLRRLAQVDSALAHLFGFHHLQIAGVLLYGSPAQQEAQLRKTVAQRLFWGNALNPLDKRAIATAVSGGFLISGTKSFASGSVGSDVLTISAWHEASGSALIAAVPTQRAGITVNADWDAFGQRQTDSGTVSFDRLLLRHDDVLQAPGVEATPRATVRSQVAQLIMANLYLGIAIGAFEEARRYTREEARPWFMSGVTTSADDPYVQQRYGEFWLQLRPAIALADIAAEKLDAAFARGEALTADERGELAIAVAEAKTLSHRASLAISSELFELTGARSTSSLYGYDRFWRNARVHTLHDPIDYKIRDLGRYALAGAVPEPTPYS